MTLTLHLGVMDIPYANAPSKRQQRRVSGTETTGDVAGYLENKYHVMEVFYELHQEKIADLLVGSLQGTLENLALGAPPTTSPFGTVEGQIGDMFRKFLSGREMDALGYPGVPTKAALEGVSHRFLHPYARRGARPSFIDTGLYESSFTAWID